MQRNMTTGFRSYNQQMHINQLLFTHLYFYNHLVHDTLIFRFLAGNMDEWSTSDHNVALGSLGCSLYYNAPLSTRRWVGVKQTRELKAEYRRIQPSYEYASSGFKMAQVWSCSHTGGQMFMSGPKPRQFVTPLPCSPSTGDKYFVCLCMVTAFSFPEHCARLP